MQEQPIPTHDGFSSSDENKVTILKACEELGLNLLTTRSIESGKLNQLPLPYSVGQLKGSVPRTLQVFKSLDLKGHNI